MTISDRIRKIREYRGLKQVAVANEMHISQQAYSWLERKSGNIKVETLKRFCDVMKVDLPFLLANQIPITDENMQMFDKVNYSGVFEDYKKLKNKVNTYEELIFRRQSHGAEVKAEG
ncbi:MAG TPA: helix-turn-helix transcriptional regulator [Chitinophagales bacterium]|nr:helix-turn-helix transcriptional regulator [Chitinophagales bacterium]